MACSPRCLSFMKVKHTKFIYYHPLHLWSETNAVLHQLASLWLRLYHLVLAVQFALQSDEFQTEGGFPVWLVKFLLTPLKLFTYAFAIKSSALKKLIWHFKKMLIITKRHRMIRVQSWRENTWITQKLPSRILIGTLLTDGITFYSPQIYWLDHRAITTTIRE